MNARPSRLDAPARPTALVLLVSLAAACPSAAQTSNPVFGHWRTADGAAIIRIAPCGATLCGRLVWVVGAADARDDRNPDRSRRSAPICGSDVFSGFQRTEGGHWTDGSIYDPESGEAIGGVALEATGDTLTLTVGRDLFAGSETWQRVAAPPRPCGRG
jgi:uncharacterized protein (DUF2147 family)